jgi:hypothetical protein
MTPDTTVFVPFHLFLRGNALRVVTPGATQVAALEEYRGAEPGAVLRGKTLNIDN